MNFLKFKNSSRIVALAVVVTMFVTLLAPLSLIVSAEGATIYAATTASTVSPIEINAAGGTNYSLFNSGCTYSSAYSTDGNYAEDTYTNNGYDLTSNNASYSPISEHRMRLGLSFTMNITVNERSNVTIYAYDIDENGNGYGNYNACKERDYVFLMDETTNTEYQLDGYMSGLDDQWSTTSFNIDSELLVAGHTYHFEFLTTCSSGSNCGWWSYVRTVNLIVNGSTGPVAPATGIENVDLTASISSSGLVSVDLTANAYLEETYTLEYKAVCSSNLVQYGGIEYSVIIPMSNTTFNKIFTLESGAPRGTYEITVFIKDINNNVVCTRTVNASYGYSAVSYNANGGSQNLPSDTTTYSSGDVVTVLFDYVPSRYEYVFLGWSTDPYATVPQYTENGNNIFTIGSNDITLYAVWGEAHRHSDNNNDHMCDGCGEVLSYCTDVDNNHLCDVCGTVISDCVESDWIIVSEPTTATTGLKKKVCLICGTDIEMEIIPTIALIDIEEVDTKVGAVVNVSVYMQNNPGVLGAVLTLTYDPVLELLEANAGSAWSSLNLTKPGRYNNYCNFVWDGIDEADTTNGTIITLTFKVPDDANVGDVYFIDFSYTDGNIVNADNEAIKVEISGGSISVTQLKGDVNDDGIVDLADVVTLRRYVAGGYDAVINEPQSDMNEDGQITISDIIELRKYIVNN